MEKLENLKTIRINKDLSRLELSKLSGVSVQNIQALEEGITQVDNVKLSTLVALAKALKVKVIDLLPKDLHRYIR